MKLLYGFRFVRTSIFICLSLCILAGCDKSSSPEGRMSIRLENLQKEMMDSLKKQNTAILDSLSKIREEIKELKRERR